MGNYLLSLRVPPPTPGEREHERHHPLYYDWSLPKWSPFRVVEQQARVGPGAAASQGGNLVAELTAADRNDKRGNKTQPPATGSGASSGGGKLAVAAKSAIKSTKEAIHKSLKSTLTSTVDRADTKPANADKTNATAAKKPGGGGAKSTGSGAGNHKPATTTTTREAAHAASSMRKSGSGQSAAAAAAAKTTIKRVDIMRPQTVDPARNGGIDDQAALKAASNIHTVAGSDASSTRKRVPAS